jgi:hypothetical protein
MDDVYYAKSKRALTLGEGLNLILTGYVLAVQKLLNTKMGIPSLGVFLAHMR